MEGLNDMETPGKEIYEMVDRNWYSDESRRNERGRDLKMLAEMKEMEREFEQTHRRIREKTPCGVRIRYVKKR